MGAPFLGVYPIVNIGGDNLSSPMLHSWMTRTIESGGSVWVTSTDPLLSTNRFDSDRSQWESGGGYVTARRFDPWGESVSGTLWMWCMPRGRYWDQQPFVGAALNEVQGENNIVPLYASPTEKYGAVKFTGSTAQPILPWSGDGRFWRDFGVAAIVVAASAAAIVAVTAPAAIAPGVLTPAATAPSDWAIATSGMGEGMGTAVVVPAAVAPTVASTVAEFVGGVVKTAENVAKAVVAASVAVGTVKDAINPPAPAEPPPSGELQTVPINPMYIAGALGLLVIFSAK